MIVWLYKQLFYKILYFMLYYIINSVPFLSWLEPCPAFYVIGLQIKVLSA